MAVEATPKPQDEGVVLALESAAASLTELTDIEEYYFGPDKDAKKQAAFETVLACVDTAMACTEAPGSVTSAKANIIKGRALCQMPGKDSEAEDLLGKALKLEPRLVDAWNALGEVYWNQGHYKQARNIFEQAIDICGPNSVSLRGLSMVLRALDGDEFIKSSNFTTALQKAKEATVLGPNDPLNWETLGNAYMGEFFVNGKHWEELNKALLAYNKAEQAYEKMGKHNPFLFLNRAEAAKFVEDYDIALKSYQSAGEIGATRGVQEYDKVVSLVKMVGNLISRRADMKNKKLKEVIDGLLPSCATLQQFRKKEANGRPIGARVIQLIDRKDECPVLVVCTDSTGEFFCLSIYNAEQAKIAESVFPLQTALEISKPHFRMIQATVKGAEVAYPCIRIAHPGDLNIPGIGSLSAAAVKAAFTSSKATTSETPEPPPSTKPVMSEAVEAALEAAAAVDGVSTSTAPTEEANGTI